MTNVENFQHNNMNPFTSARDLDFNLNNGLNSMSSLSVNVVTKKIKAVKQQSLRCKNC